MNFEFFLPINGPMASFLSCLFLHLLFHFINYPSSLWSYYLSPPFYSYVHVSFWDEIWWTTSSTFHYSQCMLIVRCNNLFSFVLNNCDQIFLIHDENFLLFYKLQMHKRWSMHKKQCILGLGFVLVVMFVWIIL